MRKMQHKKWASLILAFLIMTASAVITVKTGSKAEDTWYDVKMDAAQRMNACMERIREYKKEVGLELIPEDYHGTGILGADYTYITTTLGAVEAKRTTANPDMAAMVVQMLVKAGVSPGDTVGAGFSGSFPGLNLAVLCACDAMGVRYVYISSVGSSTYGANQPELTFPDMACRLVKDGLVSNYPTAITLGGTNDVGAEMEPQLRQMILNRLEQYEIPIWNIADYEENIAARMNLYEEEGPIACFIGVGGNLTTMGLGYTELGQGVLRPRNGLVTPKSGLVERYRAEGIPAIFLLNVKKLVADYGLAYDPEVLPELGTSAVFFRKQYSAAPALAGILLTSVILAWGFKVRKKELE